MATTTAAPDAAPAPPSPPTVAAAWTPPRIDLSPFLHNNDPSPSCEKKHATACRLRAACQAHGLFLVPFPPSLTTSAPAALQAANALFSLPPATKRTLPLVSRSGFIRGYIPVGGESGLKGQFREMKEGFSYGYPWGEEEEGGSSSSGGSGTAPPNPLQGPNQWPDPSLLLPAGATAGEWRATLNQFFTDVVAVAEALVRALSLALGKEEGYLATRVCGGGESISLVRAFHYLGVEDEGEGEEKGVIGSSPHTDWCVGGGFGFIWVWGWVG